MFKRNVITELEQWAARKNRKPLILRGSRQVGKTTLVDSFAANFENYLYLNFEKQPKAMVLFEKEQEIPDLLAEIFLFCKKKKKAGKTLLFIDEIQNSKTAITKLRYFYEEKRPDLYVVAAGSLLETMLNKKFRFLWGVLNIWLSAPVCLTNFYGRLARKFLKKHCSTAEYPKRCTSGQ